MAEIVWNGYCADALILSSTRTVAMSLNSADHSGNYPAVVNSLTANLALRTNAYGKTYNLTLGIYSSSGGLLCTKTVSVKLSNTGN